MIQCDMKEIPFLGLIGIVSHRAVNTARGMYREFDLNRSQASVLFMLHQQDSMSQKELAAKLNITAPSRRWRGTSTSPGSLTGMTSAS